MKKIFFIFIILSNFKVYSQLSNTCWKSDIDLNYLIIGFTSEDTYTVTLTHYQSIDYIKEIFLSKGIYHEYKDSIILIDEFYKFKFIIAKGKNKLTIHEAYNFLNKKEFEIVEDGFCDIIKNDNFCTECFYKEGQQLLQSNPTNIYKNELKYGCYGYKSSNSISLNHNNTYEYYYLNYLISEGFWVRKGKNLIFYDKNLKFRFDGIINNNSIKPVTFPGEFRMINLPHNDTK